MQLRKAYIAHFPAFPRSGQYKSDMEKTKRTAEIFDGIPDIFKWQTLAMRRA